MVVIITGVSCNSHSKRALVHEYKQMEPDGTFLYWYVLMNANHSSYYYYSSTTMVSDFSSINFVSSTSLPFTTEEVSELPSVSVDESGFGNDENFGSLEDVPSNVDDSGMSTDSGGGSSTQSTDNSDNSSSSGDSGGSSDSGGGGDGGGGE